MKSLLALMQRLVNRVIGRQLKKTILNDCFKHNLIVMTFPAKLDERVDQQLAKVIIQHSEYTLHKWQ
jgi:hypothetical protein